MEKSQVIDIKQFDMFYDIDYSSIDRLIEFGQIKKINHATLLIEENQDNESIFFLIHGIAYRYCLFNNDTKRILTIEKQGCFLNEDALYQKKATSNIEVLKNAIILEIPISIVKLLIDENSFFSKKIHISLEKKYLENQYLLKLNSYQNSTERLLAYLNYLADKIGIDYHGHIEIPYEFSVVFLSQLIASKRETTSRILNQLIDCHLIYYHHKHLVVKPNKKMYLKSITR